MGKPITIKLNKPFVQSLTGIALIVLTFIANGFLSFIVVGFDFSQILHSEFWANFGILFASEMACLYGMFIIQKTKDLQNEKLTSLQKHIEEKRNVVYGVDKVTEAENWLYEIYNYREKLLLFENKIRKLHSKIILDEPKKEDKDYEQKLLKYNKLVKLRDYYLQQLKFVKQDKERLGLMIKKDKAEQDKKRIEELEEVLNDKDYAFKTAKIKYQDVYWGNLLSDIEDSKSRLSSPFFSERKEMSKNLMRYFAMGLMGSAILSALIFPSLKAIGLQAVLGIIFNLLILLFFMARGIVLSNRIFLGTYYKALEKRKSIYNQMLKDLGISRIIIEDENE